MKSYSWIAALLVCAALAPLATRGTVNAEDEEEKPGAEKDRDGEGESTGKTVLGTSLSLERLVQLNAKSLFGGGKVTVKDGRVEVLLDADGHLYSAFRGKGLMDSTHERMKGANRRFIQYGTEEDKKKGSGKEKEEEKLLPGLTAVGMGVGLWISRFPLAGETSVKFDMRVPNILTRESSLGLRINWDGKSGYESRFFNSIVRISRGRVRGARATTLRKYKPHPRKWFPRKGEPVPIEFGVKDGRATVVVDGKTLVTYPRVKDEGGSVVFAFRKILFTVQNLRISGKLDLEWCEKRLAELEERGEMVDREPEKPPEAPAGDGEGKGEGGGEGGGKPDPVRAP